MAIFQYKIIVFQGQFPILSAFSIEKIEKSVISIAVRSTHMLRRVSGSNPVVGSCEHKQPDHNMSEVFSSRDLKN